MSNFISIDFGTSSSAVAKIKGEDPVLVAPITVDAAGSRIFPTTAFVDAQNRIHVCHEAELRKNMDLSRYIKEFKLDMTAGNHPFLPTSYTSIVSEVLKTLKSAAEYSIEGGADLDKLVITIPAIYDSVGDPRKGIMSVAAQQAGFKSVEFLNESEAAAIYFDYLRDGSQDGITLIYDLGGGTFDPSLIEHRDNKYILLGNGAGVEVGGKFFTEKIIDSYKESINYEEPQELTALINESNQIVELCELLKRQLSTIEEAVTPKNFRITRQEFESAISDDVRRTLESCNKLIGDCNKSWSDIDNILLIGGSCAIPFVRKSVIEYSQTQGSNAKLIWRDRYRDNAHFDPQFAVALGGAIYAKGRFAPKRTIGYIQFCECGEFKNVILKEGVSRIGRYSQNSTIDIPIKAATNEEYTMSRTHCQIEAVYDSQKNIYHYLLSDLNSENGTYVNGERLAYNSARELKSGDVIMIGAHEIEINC